MRWSHRWLRPSLQRHGARGVRQSRRRRDGNDEKVWGGNSSSSTSCELPGRRYREQQFVLLGPAACCLPADMRCAHASRSSPHAIVWPSWCPVLGGSDLILPAGACLNNEVRSHQDQRQEAKVKSEGKRRSSSSAKPWRKTRDKKEKYKRCRDNHRTRKKNSRVCVVHELS